MKQNIKPCKCGSVEFITEPNQYDVYQIIEDKLELVNTLTIDDDCKLFCRECGKELNLNRL